MRALITGANGQLGRALQRFAPADCRLAAFGHVELDITDAHAVEAALAAGRYDVLINAAAYTNVEAAERDTERAYRTNALAPGTIARACAVHGVHLVHVSTDFVFDGAKGAPYTPEDAPAPLNVYGASKLEGERNVASALPGRACIVRTSWVHSADGANFVTKMLERMAAGAPLRVVTDEVGAPTSVHSLARALWRCASARLNGLHHWSDAGVVSRFDYARAIASIAGEIGLLATQPEIVPARVADFPSSARRPTYSVLDTRATQAALGITPPSWQDGLRLTLQDILERKLGRNT